MKETRRCLALGRDVAIECDEVGSDFPPFAPVCTASQLVGRPDWAPTQCPHWKCLYHQALITVLETLRPQIAAIHSDWQPPLGPGYWRSSGPYGRDRDRKAAEDRSVYRKAALRFGAVDYCAPGAQASPPKEAQRDSAPPFDERTREREDAILEAVSHGRKLEAMRLYRQLYGGTAQDAKRFVNGLADGSGRRDPAT